MFEGLYLVHDEKKDWWQLRVEGNYLCISCTSGRENIEKCIRNIVKKYRSELKLLNALHGMESHRLSETEYKRQHEIYKTQGHLHQDIIRKAVREAYEEIKMDTPVIQNSKKFKKVNLFPTTSEVILPKEELPKEEVTVRITIPKARQPVHMGFKIKLNTEE